MTLGSIALLLFILGLIVRYASNNSSSSANSVPQRQVSQLSAPRNGKSSRGGNSERFGYRFELPKGWSNWDNINMQIGGGTARSFQGGGGFVLIPATIDDANLNNETLAAAFFSGAGTSLRDANNGTRKAIKHKELSGTQFEFRTNRDGLDEMWVARIFRGQRIAYFAAVFMTRAKDSKIDQLAGVLDLVALEEPLTKPELTAYELACMRHFFNHCGIHALHQGNFAQAVELFQKSLIIENDTTVLGNLCAAAERGGFFQLGYDEIQKRIPNHLGTPELLAYQARFEQQLGQLDAAETTYRALFSGDFDDEEVFRDFAGLLWRRDKKEEAYTLAQKRAEQVRSTGSRLLLANMEAETDPDRAIETITSVLRDDPSNVRALIQKAETLADAGRYSESMAEVRIILDQGYEYPYVYFLKGRAELGLSLLREAQQSLELARKGMPNDEATIALQERVAGLLGQGSRAILKEPIDPLPLPAMLAEFFTQKAPAFDPGAHQAYYALVGRTYHFQKNERFKTTEHSHLVITGPEGARMYTVLQLPIDPLSERVYVNELTVHTADGKVLQGDPESYFVMDDASRGVSTHKQLLHIPVPGLSPGATVKMVLTRLQGNSTTMPFRLDTFSCRVPALKSYVSVSGDIADTEALLPPGCQLFSNESGRLTWVAEKPEPAVMEICCPPMYDTLPSYRIGAKSGSWLEVSREYVERVERDLSPEPVRELATSLGAEASTDLDRITAVMQFLQSQIRYVAIEFGARGIEPAAPHETLSRKYGDCKDQAILGVALLRALNVNAWPALVHTDADIVPEIPSLDQFNHMVIFTSIEGGRFFDPTQRHHHPAMVVPANLGRKHALILKEDAELKKTPDYPAHASRVTAERQIRRNGDGLMAQESAAIDGYFAGSLRGFLSTMNPEMHAPALQDLFVSSGLPLRVRSVRVSDLEDCTKPLRLDMELESPRGFISGASAVVPLSTWESYLIEIQPRPGRRHRFEIPYPTTVISRSRYEIPGARIHSVSGENAFAKFSLDIKTDPQSFTLQYECSTCALRGKPEEFDSVSAMSLEATGLLHKPVSI